MAQHSELKLFVGWLFSDVQLGLCAHESDLGIANATTFSKGALKDVLQVCEGPTSEVYSSFILFKNVSFSSFNFLLLRAEPFCIFY